MRPETYSTPSGIAVTRTISNVSYGRGLKWLLKRNGYPARDLPVFRL